MLYFATVKNGEFVIGHNKQIVIGTTLLSINDLITQWLNDSFSRVLIIARCKLYRRPAENANMENDPLDIEFMRARYAKARNRYKPRQITTLLIAEGPPNNLDRYFYFEDVKTQDSLFLEIMGVLYPEQKKRYLASGRDTLLKEELLETFQEDGYWLLDLVEVPCSLLEDDIENCIPSLFDRLANEINKRTPIILIKASVYDICYAPLLSLGYNVYNERIPFPGSGQQRVFRTKFRKVIASNL